MSTVAGENYTIKVQYAGRPGYNATVNRFELLVDDVSQGIWDDDQSSNTTDIHDWKEAVVTFTAGTNATKVELREVGVDQNNGRGMRIDDIRVYGKAAPVNAGPTSVSFVNSITEIAEDADTTERTLIGELTVADDDLGTNTLSLSGADVNSFEVDGTTLYLKAGVQLSHTTQATYNVTISVTDDTIQNFTPVTLDYTLTVSEVEGPVTSDTTIRSNCGE